MQNELKGFYFGRPSFGPPSDSSEDEDRFTPRSPPLQSSIPGRNSAMVNQSRSCSRNLTENRVFRVSPPSRPFGDFSPRVVFRIHSSMDTPRPRIASSDEDYQYSSSSPTYSNEEMYKEDDVDPEDRMGTNNVDPDGRMGTNNVDPDGRVRADDVDPDGRKSARDKANLWAEIYSQALASTDQLLRALPPKLCDIPPGRLPVSITPESPEDACSGDGIQMKIDLNTTIIVQSCDEIPAKLRVEHPANAHLPSMSVTEEEVKRQLDQACVHLAHFADALMTLLSSPMEEEASMLEPEDYSAAFEVFKEEFEAFDEMFSFALKNLLKHDVALVKKHKDVQKMFWNLEYASSLGAVYHQEAHFDAVSTEVDELQRTVWSIRRNRV